MLKNIVKYINKIVHFYELVRTVFLNFSFFKYTDPSIMCLLAFGDYLLVVELCVKYYVILTGV